MTLTNKTFNKKDSTIFTIVVHYYNVYNVFHFDFTDRLLCSATRRHAVAYAKEYLQSLNGSLTSKGTGKSEIAINNDLSTSRRYSSETIDSLADRSQFRPDVGEGRAPGGTSHQQRASHQTVSVVFLANDRCLRDYDLVVAHC